MLQNNISPLAFYDSLAWQHHNREYSFGEFFTGLMAPTNLLLPFQIVRTTVDGDSIGDPITSITVTEVSTGSVTDITADAIAKGAVVRLGGAGWDMIQYPGALNLATTFNEGQHYVTVSDGTSTWYSDVLTLVDDTTGLVRIEYWHEENFYVGDYVFLDYTSPMRHRVYLKSQIGKPEYNVEEEAERRNGRKFILWQASTKTFRFDFVAPEFLLDATRIIPLHDNVEILWRGYTYEVDDIIISSEWMDQGHLAVAQVEFTTDTVIQGVGRAILPSLSGDYNDDYNNDYLIS